MVEIYKYLEETAACILEIKNNAEQVLPNIYKTSANCVVSFLSKSAFYLRR
jgi:hypothetical protein